MQTNKPPHRGSVEEIMRLLQDRSKLSPEAETVLLCTRDALATERYPSAEEMHKVLQSVNECRSIEAALEREGIGAIVTKAHGFAGAEGYMLASKSGSRLPTPALIRAISLIQDMNDNNKSISEAVFQEASQEAASATVQGLVPVSRIIPGDRVILRTGGHQMMVNDVSTMEVEPGRLIVVADVVYCIGADREMIHDTLNVEVLEKVQEVRE